MCPQPQQQTSSVPSDDPQSQQYFNCSICLDLVYKPIVQACGHIFCFWCVFQAMNVQKESHCSICRRPYMYFPRVCQLLHFALSKAFPDEYQKRGQEIQRTEEQTQVFSPQLELKHNWSPRSLEGTSILKVDKLTPLSTPRESSIQSSLVDLKDVSHESPSLSKEIIDCGSSDISLTQSSLTVDDFGCSLCHRLVYRPTVLNCGEVFCASCLKMPKNTSFRCPSCTNIHPGGSLFICLELQEYLESIFPTEYMNRKEEVMHQNTTETIQLDDCNLSNTNSSLEGHLHAGVGCDGCGMFPIIGCRYQCEDCLDKIGFDLCEPCYKKGGDFVGRFNQEHKWNHHMVKFVEQSVIFNMQNGTIQRRRRQQEQQRQGQQMRPDDFDDYIDSFLG